MISPLLVIDAHYMCHRAFWSQRDASWLGVPTGVIFGFLKSIQVLKNQFATDRISFCFETAESLRRKVFPDYKKKRELQKKEPEIQAARKELCRQIDLLRENYLPAMGFRNVFCYPGYESDDIMARLAQRDDWVILITSDQDLYQCVRKGVSIYSPHQQELMTETKFRKKYGIEPRQWAIVKALAGCSTDGVPGIGKVGEATALKMIKAGDTQLTRTQKHIVHRNRRLVELPFEACPVPEPIDDKLDRDGWDTICRSLGMKSLIGRLPVFNSVKQPTLI